MLYALSSSCLRDKDIFFFEKEQLFFRAQKNRENIRSSCRTFLYDWKGARSQMKKRILEFLVSKILFLSKNHLQILKQNIIHNQSFIDKYKTKKFFFA
jgi:hypothetical protein